MLSFREYQKLIEAAERPKPVPLRLPPIIVFKRRGIRLFPDGQEVGSYYSDEIKKTFIYPTTY